MGAGFILHDSLGSVLLAGTRRFDHVDEPELAEAMALRVALSTTLHHTYSEVMVVSDCANLITKINDKHQDRSHTGAVIFDIKQLAAKFSSICFSHQSRMCNRAAHTLAHVAESVASVVWVNEVPDQVQAIICNELVSEY
jgi:hypothetical protein